jgi:hypothetical protein
MIQGLPALAAQDLALFTQAGEVAVAAGRELTVYRLDGSTAEAAWRVRLREPISALAESAAGLVVSAGKALYRAANGEADRLADLDGEVHSLAAAGLTAYAVVSRARRLDGALVEVDIERQSIASERALASSAVRLALDPTGAQIGIADGSTFRTLRLSRAEPCAGSSQPQEPAPPAAPDPCGCADGQPGRPPRDEDRPKDRPPEEPCDPGLSGAPTPDGGRAVGDGSGVTRYPPGSGASINPCRAQLFFRVETLLRAGPYLVAADAQGRNTAVLDGEDLRVVQSFQQRQGMRVLSSPAQPLLLTYQRGSQTWERHAIDRIVPGALDSPPPALDPTLFEEMTFVGQPMTVLKGGRAPAVGKLRILVLPILDPGQSFTDGDLPKFNNYMKRTAFSHVREYYDENSFGQLKDITFDLFGVDAGPGGGPLRLPRPISEYFNPAYIGAHVDLRKDGVAFPLHVVFDGRERLTLDVKPMNGGRDTRSFSLKFCAALLSKEHRNFPTQLRFAGTEKGTLFVKRPNGATAALNLNFPAKIIDIANEGEVTAKLQELTTYLDGVIAAAETAAGITPRLFAPPVIRRLKQPIPGFGFLVTTLAHAAASGPRLEVTSITYSGANDDPLGFNQNILGSITINSSGGGTQTLRAYLDFIATIAQEDAGLDYTQRRLSDDPVVRVEGDKLISSFFIKEEDGGPGATLTARDALEMTPVADVLQSTPNSEVTFGRSLTPRDGEMGFDGLVSDIFTAAVERMAPPGQHPQNKDRINDFFRSAANGYQAVIVGLIDPPKTNPADPEFVRPEELWAAGPNSHIDGQRAVEGPRTAVYRPFKDIQFSSNWSLVFFTVKPDYAIFCHELGHALGLGDLYAREAGYRDDLLYMNTWAMMGDHSGLAHHCGYHKWQAGWIPDSRVLTIEPAQPDHPFKREVLLAPVEYWLANDALVDAARKAYNTPDLPVVQLVQLDIGGDADVFDLIEARQKGRTDGLPPRYSQNLPAQPAVLITNCVVWWDENRYAFNDRYRAPVHPLHEPATLKDPGDRFDLARAVELPEKGIIVTILDRKTVSGVEVFRLQIERENSAFIDLYFSSADPYYRNPDLWVDWTGDNGPGGKTSSADRKDRHVYPLGQPVDQGEAVVTPPSGEELHWMVARVRNRGGVKAEQVKFNFSVCEPSGGGDRGNFKLKASVTQPEVNPTKGNDFITVPGEWRVPADLKRHTCIMVEIADWKIPRDDEGVALASNDSWEKNNRAQKNVDVVGPRANSPYEPIEFDFSVNNSARWPEVAYLEPDGLPAGMRLTVRPKRRTIAAGETAIFRCKLELDEKVIDASCLGDRDFRILVWRVAGHSAVRWGGVHYKVRPRKGSFTDLHGSWDAASNVEVSGSVAPDPGGGFVRIRLAYDGFNARWVSAPLLPGGTFTYQERAPASALLNAIALYEGNQKLSESRSPERRITPPPPIR